MERFEDRNDAGRQLAAKLLHLRGEDVIVLALPRGGVPVAIEVARALGAPLEVLISRKLGVPFQPELGFGAIAEGGGRYVDPGTVAYAGLSQDEIERVAEKERREVDRRIEIYRGGRPLPPLAGRTVVLVDDGIATGGTVRAAVAAIRRSKPGRLVLAVPVGPPETLDVLRDEVDELVCVLEPASLWAIGAWYDDFAQLEDAEVLSWLARSREEQAGATT